MAPAYKLTYFNVTVVAEAIRFLFHYGGIEFEDERITVDQWPALKAKTPFGQIPLLEHNGKIINQSNAIARYVAKKVKLVGNDDWEDAEIDAAVDTISDFRAKLQTVYYEQNEDIKADKEPTLLNETLPYYLEKMDDQVKRNSGYFVVNRLTWADFLFVASLDYFNRMAGKDILDGYPNLKALAKKVLGLPAIKKWVETRPKTEV